MPKRTYKVAFVLVLAIILVLSIAGIGQAQTQWPDLTLSIVGKYGVTEQQVGMISDGFKDGLWRPFANMTREQFVKMAVLAYNIPHNGSPATPTYSDMPRTNQFYRYVEAANTAGLVNGIGGGKFGTGMTITREQAVAIIARYVADANNIDLSDYVGTADDILSDFPDAAAVSANLKDEMAFAVDMGIVLGDDAGRLVPQLKLMRLQGAAMLIRSWAVVPRPNGVPATIEQVTADMTENLIGLTHPVTFVVKDAKGAPVRGVLVDFDSQQSPWYVGNVQPEAALTGPDGKVTVNLFSTEVGIERVSASVPSVAKVAYATKFWLALDEVYILADPRTSRNNAGTSHTWEARVLVFGPGPLSTDQQDWYNIYRPGAARPAQPFDASLRAADAVDAGVDYNVDCTQFADEVAWKADGYVGRSLPNIPVKWTASGVGVITAATVNGTVAADGKSATAVTTAGGLTTATITSQQAGTTSINVVADYAENPYPGSLFNHGTGGPDGGFHDIDWDDQPAVYASATKTWIPHVIPGGESPIAPAYSEANIGERLTLTITVKDVYGNPVVGKEVKWFMEGIGVIDTDDDRASTDYEDPDDNWDIDNTNSAGKAQVFVESNVPGEQIIHAKVQNKPQDGAEGGYMTYTAEVQWFDVNVATFDDPTTPGSNEALSTNNVGTTHDFTLHVYGLKLEKNDLPWDERRQTSYVDGDQAGAALDHIFDARDAAYYGGILLVGPAPTDGSIISGSWPLDDNGNGVIDPDEAGTAVVMVKGEKMTISGEGGFTRYDHDNDGYFENFLGTWADGRYHGAGIYLPLDGKDVTFVVSNGTAGKSNLGEYFDGKQVDAVGGVTPATAKTDANGQAKATVTSDKKGPETIQATVDWPDNPHNQAQLIKAYAKKIWKAVPYTEIKVSIDGTPVASKSQGVFNKDVANFVDVGQAKITVDVLDQFGNHLPDYEVVYLLLDAGRTTDAGGQDAVKTYHPLAYFDDVEQEDFDTNGTAPDNDEPRPADDPYAPIVGAGGTKAFYFNQEWGLNAPGNKFFDGGTAPYTDGAKAWTRNGYIMLQGVVDQTLVGSNVWLVLDENPFDRDLKPDHVKSLVKIFVYAPAAGVVKGGTPIWSCTIHKIWDEREDSVLTGMLLQEQNPNNPAVWTTSNLTYPVGATMNLRVQMLDQYGRPMVNTLFADAKIMIAGAALPFDDQTTDADGYLYVSYIPVSAGSLSLQAWNDANGNNLINAGELTSNAKTDTIEP